jgi:ribose-phosphate pyrophosphokinase
MKIKIFALGASRSFGTEIAEHLGVELGEHEEYTFDDGECYVAPKPGIKENCRGCDVFVVQSIYSDEREDINTKLMKLVIFNGALHDAKAARITNVIPYYPYARQDRKTASRAPITTKYIANLLHASHCDHVLSIDVHNAAVLQNQENLAYDLLEAKNLFAYAMRDLLEAKGISSREVAVASPDSGTGLDRARQFRSVLTQVLNAEPMALGMACLDKVHIGKVIKGYGLLSAQDVKDKYVFIYDDMISSGKTVYECYRAVMDHGAKMVLGVCATHGLFVGKANELLNLSSLGNIFVTDTIRPFRLQPPVKNKLTIIKTTRLFAEAISCIHKDESISDLIANGQQGSSDTGCRIEEFGG